MPGKETKTIIILRHNGGRLGNQLFLFISVYAFCLEFGYKCKNYSFYNYKNYFQLPSDKFSNLLDKLANFSLYKTHRDHLIVYQIYKFFTYFYYFFNKGTLIKEDPKSIINLPPSKDNNRKHQAQIKKITSSNEHLVYLDGWHFRNPKGIKKYHKQIAKLIKPKSEITRNVKSFIEPLIKEFYLIGVHVRQGDYKRMMGGEWYFTDNEVALILKNFQKKSIKKSKPLLFILCSDGQIDMKHYKGLNVKIGIGKLMEDFFTLASCNGIIGSNSTFGEMAAYFGNIPFTAFKR